MVLRRLRSDGKEMYQNAWSTCLGADHLTLEGGGG